MAENINPLGMKSIKEAMSVPIGQTLREYLSLDWIFSTWYEKAIIVCMLVWSLYSIFNVVRGLF